MQPRPMAETSRLLFPSVRFFMVAPAVQNSVCVLAPQAQNNLRPSRLLAYFDEVLAEFYDSAGNFRGELSTHLVGAKIGIRPRTKENVGEDREQHSMEGKFGNGMEGTYHHVEADPEDG